MPVLEEALDFTLPSELEAHEPPEARGLRRDEVRLLVSNRTTGTMLHTNFTALPDVLRTGDLVVANDSGTLPAELLALRSNGTTCPLRLSTLLPNGFWTVEPRGIVPEMGERMSLPGGGEATIILPHRDSTRLWTAYLQLPQPLAPYLVQWGRPIRYSYVPEEWPLEMYQTVYHRELGSAEMPSAGRPFSERVLDQLLRRGIGFATLTLHTGVSSQEGHEAPYDEYYRIPASTAEAIRAAHAAGGRVIAVGTTVVRALETAALQGRIHGTEGWTDLVITPDHPISVVDGLLTGFHEPQASHLSMLEAIAGKEHVVAAYCSALQAGYLWHEFGDVHLIL